jgi:cytochrome c556
MSRRIVHLFSLLAALILCLPTVSVARDLVVKPPPASLSKHYPPQSKQPRWIQQMHKMSTNFGGVFVNMSDSDWTNAEMRAEKFLEAYEETSKMVPEWKDYFDLDAVRKFAASVKTHDPKAIGAASKGVGKTCGKCHKEQYVSVWTKFHWPPVHDMTIVDPLTEKEFKYGKFMHKISGSFKGVTVNFGEGQYKRSAKALRAFQKRYMELKSTCSKCHTTDNVKLFFVGEEVEQAFSGLKKELAQAKPNPGNFWKNVGTIGKLGCKKCHLTHRAYAIIQEVWEGDEH